MKTKLLSAFAFLLLLSIAAIAQTVKITPREVKYNRTKADVPDFKKTFTVTRPKVSGLTAALNKKVEDALSFEKNYKNFSVQEEIDEIYWLEEADFTVDYNKKGILVVTLFISGSGAYPSGYGKTVVVDLKTGSRVRPADAFTNLSGLAALGRRMQREEIRRAQAEYKRDPETKDFDGSEYFSRAKFTVAELNDFSVDDKGVTFIYEYNFAHVVKALAPDGRYFFTWAQMKPFIKRGGLLGGFVR
jgi:hypothetical protein